MKNPSQGGQTTSTENSVELENMLKVAPWRVKAIYGRLRKDMKLTTENTPSVDRSRFNCERYKFFLEDGAPNVSNQCCNVMKKSPAHAYSRKTGRKPITAQMASESRLRTQKWIQHGCNGFDLKIPTSNPMAFWTEQDVLAYILEHENEMIEWRREEIRKKRGCEPEKLIDLGTGKQVFPPGSIRPICSVYGEVVTDYEKQGQVEGQLSFAGLELFDFRPPLKTTGCSRTGCVFCGFGCHLEKQGQGRFERLGETHEQLADYCMRGGAFDENGIWKPDNRGLGMWYCIEWINKHGNFNIQYQNREHYLETYMTDETRKYL